MRVLAASLLAVLLFVGAASAWAEVVALDDVALAGGYQAAHNDLMWDLTQGDLVLSFTYDANGLVDQYGGSAHAWGEIGVRSVGYGDFNPTWMAGGAGVWLATDYDWSANTFAPDPPNAPKQDLDDKLILQRGGGMDESYYNLPSAPPNPWNNYAVWFDRDGVDQWQATYWGAKDGITYNTGGIYDVVITLHATSPTTATAYMSVNGEPQGFYAPWRDGPPQLWPVGMTFTGDMTRMQVFWGIYGYGATHSVAFTDITVNGTLYTIPVDINIKDGGGPAPINIGANGVVPVSVLTTPAFNAMDVFPATVLFAGASPERDQMADVDGDGDLDLLMHVRTSGLALDATSTTAVLTGGTWIGQPIKGSGAVKVIVPKGPKK